MSATRRGEVNRGPWEARGVGLRFVTPGYSDFSTVLADGADSPLETAQRTTEPV